jgi:uncharacterized membrane protein (UPF0127 family)
MRALLPEDRWPRRRRFGVTLLLLSLVAAFSVATPLAGLSSVLGGQALAQSAEVEALRRDALVIVSPSGRHRFEVEIAETPADRARGLMFRTELTPDAGMLFDFKEEREVAFWMRNTLIPLDMLFIEKSGRIAHIARNATPLSEELVPSRAVVRYVLEIPGGRAAELDIKVGDVVQAKAVNGGD